jgi:IS30 family transposase
MREKVQQDLRRRYSPQQIAGRSRREFPDDAEMWVSTETIYQSLSNRAVPCDVIWRAVCAAAARCAARAANPGSARTASRT